MDPASLLVAGAAAFCAAHPGHAACRPEQEIAPITLTADRAAFIASIAARMYADPDAGVWRDELRQVALERQDYRGDCLAEALWAIAQFDDEWLQAAEIVLWFNSDNNTDAHIAILVWTTTQALILDGVDGQVQAFTHAEMRALAPLTWRSSTGIAGRWTKAAN